MRERIPLRFLLAGAALLASLWFLRRALAPFFIALIAAYLLDPLVAWLERRMARGWAVALVLLLAVGVAAGLLALFVPWLGDQAQRISANLPAWQAAIGRKAGPWLEAHPWAAAKLKAAAAGLEPADLLEGLKRTGGGLLGFVLGLLELILVPLILYYLLMEGRALLAAFESLVPPRLQPRADRMLAAIHARLGGYIRGQLAVALVMSALQGLALALLGVPYAGLLGLLAGFATFIPYSPYVTALPVALLLAFLEGGRGGALLLLALVFVAVQKVEALYLTPVWVGRASKLHPLEVLLALIVFGTWFGVLGLAFAVPLMVVAKVAWEDLLEDYQASPWYTGGSAPGGKPSD
ncbi:MAG TPA: AI-2E family transporter [Holophagaceae bacterium]|nr:AI-2E family transporter [Holophagaceae bacterium]